MLLTAYGDRLEIKYTDSDSAVVMPYMLGKHVSAFIECTVRNKDLNKEAITGFFTFLNSSELEEMLDVACRYLYKRKIIMKGVIADYVDKKKRCVFTRDFEPSENWAVSREALDKLMTTDTNKLLKKVAGGNGNYISVYPNRIEVRGNYYAEMDIPYVPGANVCYFVIKTILKLNARENKARRLYQSLNKDAFQEAMDIACNYLYKMRFAVSGVLREHCLDISYLVLSDFEPVPVEKPVTFKLSEEDVNKIASIVYDKFKADFLVSYPNIEQRKLLLERREHMSVRECEVFNGEDKNI